MDYKTQKIECPVCHHEIYFNIDELIKGVAFTCSHCKSSISLSASSTKEVSRAMEQFEKFRITHSVKK